MIPAIGQSATTKTHESKAEWKDKYLTWPI